MNRMVYRRVAVMVTCLLALVAGLTLGVSTATARAAAQSATPVPPPAFEAAEVTSADFAQTSYTLNPGESASVSYTVGMTGSVDGNFTFTTDPGLTMTGAAVEEGPGFVLCTINPNGDFTSLAGRFIQDFPIPSYCTFTFTINVDPATAPGTTIALLATFNDTENGNLITRTALIDVPPLPLVANDATLVVSYEHSVTGTLTAAGGKLPLTYQPGADGPDKGMVTIEADGSFTYTAGAGQTGADSFTFLVTDAHTPQQQGTGTVTVTIGDPVTANDQAVTVPYQGSVDGAVTASGGVPPLGYVLATPPTRGSVTVHPDGSFTYIAGAGQTGPDSFTFTASDGSTPPLTDDGLVTITIGAPDALVTTTLTLTVNAGETVTGNLSGQVAGGIPPYAFALASPPAQGTVTVNPDGTFAYTANADAGGPDSFTYTVTDSQPAATATTGGTVAIVIVPGVTPGTPPATPPATPAQGTVVPGQPDDGDNGPANGNDGGGGQPGDESNGAPVNVLPSTGGGTAADHAGNGPLVPLLLIGLGLLATVATSRAMASRKP